MQGREHPSVPEDLHLHRCLNIRLASGLYRWEYSHNGVAIEILPPIVLITNDGDTLMQAIRAGADIGGAFEAQVKDEIDSGQLIALLEAWWPNVSPFYLYYSSRTHVPRKLRVFIDFMKARLNA